VSGCALLVLLYFWISNSAFVLFDHCDPTAIVDPNNSKKFSFLLSSYHCCNKPKCHGAISLSKHSGYSLSHGRHRLGLLRRLRRALSHFFRLTHPAYPFAEYVAALPSAVRTYRRSTGVPGRTPAGHGRSAHTRRARAHEGPAVRMGLAEDSVKSFMV